MPLGVAVQMNVSPCESRYSSVSELPIANRSIPATEGAPHFVHVRGGIQRWQTHAPSSNHFRAVGTPHLSQGFTSPSLSSPPR